MCGSTSTRIEAFLGWGPARGNAPRSEVRPLLGVIAQVGSRYDGSAPCGAAHRIQQNLQRCMVSKSPIWVTLALAAGVLWFGPVIFSVMIVRLLLKILIDGWNAKMA